jgi:hypothetical protein
MIEHVERIEAKEQVCSFRNRELLLRRGIEIDFIRPAQYVPPGITPVVSSRHGEGRRIEPLTHRLGRRILGAPATTLARLACLRSASEGWVGDSDDTAAPQVLQIADRKNQPGFPWTVDFHKPVSGMTHDYAIIARFHANMTDREVMVIAGLGSGGTERASKFVSSTAYMTQLARHAPRNWRSMNMEAVVETEVIGGRAGHPQIIAAELW